MASGKTAHEDRLGGWIWTRNLKPFLESSALALDGRINDDDWDAVRYGIQGTSDVDNRWFGYELSGPRHCLDISLALDEGGATDIVHVRIGRGFDAATKARIETLIAVCNSYEVSDHKV